MDVITMLMADDAASVGGKLYIHGGGWDTVYATALPTVVARLALVITLRVEHHEALETHPIIIDLVDADDQPLGDNKKAGNLRVGLGAGLEPGQPTLISQVLRFEQLKFERTGLYTFRVFVGETPTPLERLSFRVAPVGL